MRLGRTLGFTVAASAAAGFITANVRKPDPRHYPNFETQQGEDDLPTANNRREEDETVPDTPSISYRFSRPENSSIPPSTWMGSYRSRAPSRPTCSAPPSIPASSRTDITRNPTSFASPAASYQEPGLSSTKSLTDGGTTCGQSESYLEERSWNGEYGDSTGLSSARYDPSVSSTDGVWKQL